VAQRVRNGVGSIIHRLPPGMTGRMVDNGLQLTAPRIEPGSGTRPTMRVIYSDSTLPSATIQPGDPVVVRAGDRVISNGNEFSVEGSNRRLRLSSPRPFTDDTNKLWSVQYEGNNRNINLIAAEGT